jgi:hypothetical protein
MSLDAIDAFKQGLRRIASKSGVIVIAILAAVSFVGTIANQTFNRGWSNFFDELLGSTNSAAVGGPGAGPGSALSPLAFDVPFVAALVLVLVVAVLVELSRVVAIRAFASPDPSTFPTDAVTDGLGFATLNVFLVMVVVNAMTQIGFFLLVLPGVFLTLIFGIFLFFFRQEVALTGGNLVDGLTNGLSRVVDNGGDVVVLFFILTGVWVLTAIPSVIFGFVVGAGQSLAALSGTPAGPRTVSDGLQLAVHLLEALLTGVYLAVALSVSTRAYLQTREDDEDFEPVGTA